MTRWESVGLTLIGARTTTVPRSNGPASARIAITSENGPPPYGPARYTGPESENGAEPAPEATVDVPTRLASGQAPWTASASSQSGTLWMIPSRPGGCVTVSPLRYCWPSSREIVSANGENAPAARLALPAVKPSANGVAGHAPPAPSTSTVKLVPGVASALPEYGVILLVVAAVPQASGFASVAAGPPFSLSLNSVNGTCGVSAKVVLSWPVAGSGVTVPLSRTDKP